MVDKREVYKRYNRMLETALQKYFQTYSSQLNSDEPLIKIKLFERLKPVLDRSAVIKRNLPGKYVPMQEVYRELYSEIYGSLYFEMLREGNLSEISKFEKMVFRGLIKKLLRFNFRKFIKLAIRQEVGMIFRSSLERITSLMVFRQGHFCFRFVSLIFLLSSINAMATLVIEGAKIPYVTNFAKIAHIQRSIDNIVRIVMSNRAYSEGVGVTMGGLVSRGGARNEMGRYDKALANAYNDSIKHWLEANGFFDEGLWREFMGAPPDKAALCLKRLIRGRLSNEYRIIVYSSITNNIDVSEEWDREVSKGTQQFEPIRNVVQIVDAFIEKYDRFGGVAVQSKGKVKFQNVTQRRLERSTNIIGVNITREGFLSFEIVRRYRMLENGKVLMRNAIITLTIVPDKHHGPFLPIYFNPKRG
ncbi:MAG: hypothetical protein QF824_05225 [Candidatus Woesearchaeota archaeon]|jgi:hypothetical protein|nr:hypothetical protein [Candidatus Woesearchaeota archaeon]